MRLKQWSVPVLVIAALAVGAIGWRAGAQNGQAPTGRIASVDLTRLVDMLEEREAREQELKSFIEMENQKIQEKGDLLQLAQDDMVAIPEGNPARRRKAEEVARLRIDLEVQGRFSEQLIDRRRAEVFASLFEKIEEGVEVIALQQGIDLVISDDAGGPIPRDTESQIRGVMSARRVLFTSQAIDITDAVARMLNNQWNAGRAANAGGAP